VLALYPEFSSNYPLLLTTFMKRPVNLYPNHEAIVYRNPDTGEYFRFTWRQWYERTCRLVNALKNTFGIQPGSAKDPGDRVATMAYNHHRHLELYYAIPCSGAVLHPINIRLSLEHITYTIQHSEDKFIFVDDVCLPILEQIYDQIKDGVKAFIYISDKPGLPKTKVEPLIDYEELIAKQDKDFDWPYLHEDSYATLCYTTGTTGLPKGVMFTHRALYLITMHTTANVLFNPDPKAEKLGESAVQLLNTPLYHIHGWGVPYSAVFAANKIVLPGRFTVDGFCELVEKEKVTTSGVVPTVLAMIVESDILDKYDLSSLKALNVGGGALPLGLKLKAEQLIPGFSAGSGYGMTETAPTTVRAFVKKNFLDLPPEKLDEYRVKTGIPIPGLEVQVVDENLNPVPKDNQTLGEIVIRGPWVMEGYYKNPEQSEETWRDGWFHTGDVARIDEEGVITIGDRVSDMIRSGAEMVPTVLLENITATADFVLEATYVGVSDPIWGQRPMALVTLTPDSNKGVEDIMNWLMEEGVAKGKITKWMLPDYMVITNDIPKTSVGKFDKKVIRSEMDHFLEKAVKVGK